jgi:hypothetical protein
MDEASPLSPGILYTLDQLVAVLGEPYVRKNSAPPSPDRGASRRRPRVRVLAPTTKPANDKPRAGVRQVLVWNCEAGGGGCMAYGDPLTDQWYAGLLCYKHGGVPYDIATAATDEDLAKRESWVRAFWGHLSDLFGSIDQISDYEAMCGRYRVRVSPPKPGDSISGVTSVGCRSWRANGTAEERVLFMGCFSMINSSPRGAVIDVLIRSQEDRTVELEVSGQDWVRGRVTGRYPSEITLRFRDGTKRVLTDDDITGFREAKRSPRSTT